MSLDLKFRWSDVHGEGFINKTDLAQLLEEDWVVAADFLKDVIQTSEVLYNEVLARNKVGGTVMAIFCRGLKEAEE